MKHTYFKMKGNKHLALRGIDTVSITPQERLQIILGTNGSGKSTVMKNLSCLSADPNHFYRGGYKLDIVEKNSSVYECLSDFTSDKNHYKFTKDNEVIYEGHVASAYNEYVKAHIGVTEQIHDLSIGKIRFTEMSTDDKRTWFTNLSPVDFSYAIGYYKRLTESQRDITGAVKRLNDKLLQEKAKILDEAAVSQLEQKLEKLKETKQKILIEWRPMDITFDQALSDVERLDQELIALSDQLKRSISIYCYEEGFTDESQVHQQIGETKAKIDQINERLDAVFQEVDSNREILKNCTTLGDQDLNSIDIQIQQCVQEKTSLEKSKVYPFVWFDPITSYSVLSNHFNDIVSVINELISDPQDTITIASTQSLKQTVVDYENNKNKNLHDIASCQHLIKTMEHRKTEGHTQCPKCSHIWFKGYDENEIAVSEQTIHNLEITNTALDKKIEQLNQVIETNTYQISQYQQLVYICKSTHAYLSHMWDEIMPEKVYKRDKAKAISILHDTLSDLKLQIQINEIDAKTQDLLSQRTIAVQANDLNIAQLKIKNTQLEQELFDLNAQARSLQLWLKRLDDIKNCLQIQSRYESTVTSVLDKRSSILSKAETLNEQSLISGILANLDKEITEIDRQLGSCMSQAALVKSYQQEIDELNEKDKLLKQAIIALSPAKGLIAEGLTGFINHFIAQMNAVIEKVWLYPLSINPIHTTEEALKLDYKFSFSVEGKMAGKDVKDGSGAQKEIFDLAFMLVSMKHLSMEDHPIFLDEFSIKMDYAHRREAMRMIMELLNSSSFSQIFMVSHYENSYGSIGNADITVLCSENIELPSDLVYNKNAIIER